jgi:hypothetical protein
MRAARLHARLNPRYSLFVNQIAAAVQAIDGRENQHVLARLHDRATIEHIVDRDCGVRRHVSAGHRLPPDRPVSEIVQNPVDVNRWKRNQIPLCPPFSKGEFFPGPSNPSLEKRGRGDFSRNLSGIIWRPCGSPH